MKKTITKNDGTVIVLEGTLEEIQELEKSMNKNESTDNSIKKNKKELLKD